MERIYCPAQNTGYCVTDDNEQKSDPLGKVDPGFEVLY